MSDTNKSDGTGFALTVVFTLVVLAVALVFGVTVLSGKKKMGNASARAATTEHVEPANPVVMLSELSKETQAVDPFNTPEAGAVASGAEGVNVQDASGVSLENGKALFFFATGQTAVAGDSKGTVAAFAKTVAAGQKVIVAGYVDNTGDAAVNAEISKKRALAVRDALIEAGIASSLIELRKPADIQAGSGAHARRVEVSVE